VAFSPDGKTLATFSVGAPRLWSVATHQQLATLKAASGGVAFSPDGNTLVSGGVGRDAGKVHFWRAATFAETDKPENLNHDEED
jgi:WD40 repeat protein